MTHGETLLSLIFESLLTFDGSLVKISFGQKTSELSNSSEMQPGLEVIRGGSNYSDFAL